jgi:S-adenosylmethionine:tRNA ribosyltransferase-isomerase
MSEATREHHHPGRPPVRPSTRFALPGDLAAAEPPEARGLPRDGVRLLAATGDRLDHARFFELGRFLNPGDLLVVNTSATRPAAVTGHHADHGPVVVHFSSFMDDGSWVVEVRTAPTADKPVRTLQARSRVDLPEGVRLVLLAPEPADQGPAGPRLWRTQPLDPSAVSRMLNRHGRPIRYGYLAGDWPLDSYQTVFADHPEPAGRGAGPGLASAEMPSAGRPFSTELVTRLIGQGVLFAPIELHAGVSSQESGEPPAAERFRVPARTASLVEWTRRTGGRVIAVGTTVTRALESATDLDADPAGETVSSVSGSTSGRADGEPGDRRVTGRVRAKEGWTELVIGPDRPVRVVDGLITGLHDPDASHLLLLEAVAGGELVQRVYDAALDERYLWHEFGDTCLLIR